MSTTSSGNDAPANPSSRLERFADSRFWGSRPVSIVNTRTEDEMREAISTITMPSF